MRAFEIILEATSSQKLKHGSNRGNVGEFLLGAAVIAKMLAGNTPATKAGVEHVMRETVKSNLSATFTSEQGDKFTFRNIIKNQKNIADITDIESLIQAMPLEINSALGFANSDQYTTKFSKIFSENGKPDSVAVEAKGEEDQAGSKADILLKYIQPDGTEKVLRPISLKVGSNLIGQGSPRTFESMKMFFKDLGVDIPDMPEYDQNVNAGVQKVFQFTKDYLTSLTSGDDITKETTLINNLHSFLNKHAALNDPKLVIVNLEKGDYSIQRIKDMIKNLNSVNLETTYKTSGQPAIVVHNAGNIKDMLFQVRYTYSAKRTGSDGKVRPERHRMFVEIGPLFKSLATVSKQQEL